MIAWIVLDFSGNVMDVCEQDFGGVLVFELHEGIEGGVRNFIILGLCGHMVDVKGNKGLVLGEVLYLNFICWEERRRDTRVEKTLGDGGSVIIEV